jgi:hypothetical protein
MSESEALPTGKHETHLEFYLELFHRGHGRVVWVEIGDQALVHRLESSLQTAVAEVEDFPAEPVEEERQLVVRV